MKKFTDIKIIELDVMMSSLPALKTCEKLGFKRGGVFPKAWLFDFSVL